MKNLNKYKYIYKVILSIIMVIIVVLFTSLGIINIDHKAAACVSCVVSDIASYSTTLFLFNNMLSGKQAEPVHGSESNREERGTKRLDFLFFVLQGLLVSNEKFLLVLVSLLLLSLYMKTPRKKKIRGNDHGDRYRKKRHYIWWVLKFLTPLQKCIENRSDEFDINPIEGNKAIAALRRARTLFTVNRVRVFSLIR